MPVSMNSQQTPYPQQTTVLSARESGSGVIENRPNCVKSGRQQLAELQAKVWAGHLDSKPSLVERWIQRLDASSSAFSGIAKIMLERVLEAFTCMGIALYAVGYMGYKVLEPLISFLLLFLVPAALVILAVLSPLWAPVYYIVKKDVD